MDDERIQNEILASFAEHLVPEAFATPTRAHRVTREISGPGPVDGAEARRRFDRGIDDRIESFDRGDGLSNVRYGELPDHRRGRVAETQRTKARLLEGPSAAGVSQLRPRSRAGGRGGSR